MNSPTSDFSVSGYAPAFMSAHQFVGRGADEIQRLNFILLNFLYPAFAAPKQREGRQATTSSDVYGLGCVLFEPIGGGSVAQLRASDGPERETIAQVARECAAPER